MKLVLPVTHHDADLFKKRNDVLLKFGGLLDHSALILHSPSAKKIAQDEYERLRPIFGSITIVETLDFSHPKEVVRQNNHFYSAVTNLARLKNTEAFLWLEPDATVTQKGAIDKLQNAYRASGATYFGNIVQMPYNDNGVLKIETGEEMMMGVGIYPPTMMDLKADIRPLIIDLGKQAGNPEKPFDIWLRGEQRRAGWANTNLIADQWNTWLYERVEGGFNCHARPVERLVRNRGGFTPDTALVIHGCKDYSLYDLLLGTKPLPVKVGPPIAEVKSPAVTTVEPASISEPSPEDLELKQKVEERLAVGSLRLNVLADETGISKDDLTEKLTHLGYVVAKPSLWIRKQQTV